MRAAQQARQLRLVGGQGLLGQALGVARQRLVADLRLGCGHAQGLHLGQQRRRAGRQRGLFVQLRKGRHTLRLAHHRAQAAGHGVEAEQ